MLTNRFLSLVQTEFQDFWGKSALRQANAAEQNMFEQIYAYFMGKENKTTTPQERACLPSVQALQTASRSEWEVVKRAYKMAMKKHHPDKFADDAEKQKAAQMLAQKINEAYQYFEKKNA